MDLLTTVLGSLGLTILLAGAYALGVSVGREFTRPRPRDDDTSMEHEHGGDDP